jgi:hypothetical protein
MQNIRATHRICTCKAGPTAQKPLNNCVLARHTCMPATLSRLWGELTQTSVICMLSLSLVQPSAQAACRT